MSDLRRFLEDDESRDRIAWRVSQRGNAYARLPEGLTVTCFSSDDGRFRVCVAHSKRDVRYSPMSFDSLDDAKAAAERDVSEWREEGKAEPTVH